MSHHQAYILDRLGYEQSQIHGLDPRAKLLATLLIIGTVISFPKYALADLVPFFIFPVVLALLGFIPFKIIARAVLLASPFFVMVGLFNPLLDRALVQEFWGISISRGWLSFFSIILRGCLCVAMAVILIGTTSFPRLVQALQSLKIPKALTIQLLLLYRYLFLLIDEAKRMNDAKLLRSFSQRTKLSTYTAMLSSLLLRSFDRADSIYLAMKARGFSGEMKTALPLRWQGKDTLFLGLVIMACLLFRIFPIAYLLADLAGW